MTPSLTRPPRIGSRFFGLRVVVACALVARALVALVALVALAGMPRQAQGHPLRPALLSVTEIAPDTYDVDLRAPIEVAILDAPVPIFPPGSEQRGGTSRTREGGSELQRFRVRVPGGLGGRRLSVRFASGSAGSEVLVRIQTRDGRTTTGRLIPRKGEATADWLVPGVPTRLVVARTYLMLGLEHILGGLDHLAFVLGLVLLTPAWRRLWRTVTAFTAAHSLTLALAALGFVHVAPPPVEAAIALSILLVAREVWLAQRESPGSAARRAWPMAFAFGLLHGLGFAGALSEVGLPASDIPIALLTFNAGVEIGQLVFVAAVLLAGRALARLPLTRRRPWLRLAPAYAIGTVAAFWCIERVARFWS